MATSYLKLLTDLKRRHPDTPLSLAELVTLKEIQYIDLKMSIPALELLAKYSCDPKFQLRLLDQAYLFTTIFPLLSTDNQIEIIRLGIIIFSSLTKNEEIYSKIKNADALKVLYNLISKKIHFEITRCSVRSLSHLAKDFELCEKIWTQNIFHFLMSQLLDTADFETQKFILKLAYWLTVEHPKNTIYKNAHKFLLKEINLKPLLRSLLSYDKKVVLHSIRVVNNLLQNFENVQVLEKYKILHRLIQTFKCESAASFQNQQLQAIDSDSKLKQKIILAIVSTIRGVSVINEYQVQIGKKKFVGFFVKIIHHENWEIACNAVICLAHIAENEVTHDELFKNNVIEEIANILISTKFSKIYMEASRFLANISWNPHYQRMLIGLNFISNLLTSSHATNPKFAIIILANISSVPHFHLIVARSHIKLMINLLEKCDLIKDDFYLTLASLILANLSSNFDFHNGFLKEPQISILYKLFQITILWL